eukprot:scaffold171509_cov33-Tisochrysis_lutea.AAC.3
MNRTNVRVPLGASLCRYAGSTVATTARTSTASSSSMACPWPRLLHLVLSSCISAGGTTCR